MDKYGDIELECGDIILIRSDSWANWAVRKITQSEWGHSAMYIHSGLYIDSDIGGVKVKHLSYLRGMKTKILRHKKMKHSEREQICSDILFNIGKGYDYRAIWELLRLLIVGRNGNDRPVGDRKKFICSELIAKYYYQKGYPISKEHDYDEIIPCDFDKNIKFKVIL